MYNMKNKSYSAEIIPKKENDFNESLKQVTREFCNKTPLHGYKYIANKTLSPGERFFWTFVVLSALIGATIVTWWAVDSEYSSNPTVTTCYSTQNYIYYYNFPSVCLCNFNKMAKSRTLILVGKIQNLTGMNENTTDDIMSDLKYLHNIFFPNYREGDYEVYNRLDKYLNLLNMTVPEAIEKTAETCSSLFKRCVWKNRVIRCKSLFISVFSPEGRCCCFNNFAITNAMEGMNSYEGRFIGYSPRKTSTCGTASGLEVDLAIKPENYLISEYHGHGVKVIIDQPYNFIDWNSHGIVVAPQRLSSIAVTPSSVKANPLIFNIAREKRGCLDQYEGKLTHFSYSAENCYNECRIYIIYKLCGCRPLYYFFNNSGINNIRICGLYDIKCLSENKGKFMGVPITNKAEKVKTISDDWENDYVCDCPNLCFFETYSLTHTETPRSSIFRTDSTIYIFYKNFFGTLNMRQPTLYWSTLFGLVGSLLSLCLGITPIAVLTFVYYYVLKLFYYTVLYDKNKLKQNSKKQNKKIIVDSKMKNIRDDFKTDSKIKKTNEEGLKTINSKIKMISEDVFKNTKIKTIRISHAQPYKNMYLPYLD